MSRANRKRGKIMLDRELVRSYDWGTAHFKPVDNLPEKVIAAKKRKYWLMMEVQPISHSVKSICTIKRESRESNKYIHPIEYLYYSSNSLKVCNMVKKRLEYKLQTCKNEYNQVSFKGVFNPLTLPKHKWDGFKR